MSVTWNIHGAVITFTITTRANGDLRKAIIEAMSSPEFPRSPAVMIDTRRETENPTLDLLRLRAGWIATLVSRRHGSRCALVARSHHRGVPRMFSILLATEGVQAEVFTTPRGARRWLTPGIGQRMGGAVS